MNLDQAVEATALWLCGRTEESEQTLQRLLQTTSHGRDVKVSGG